MGHHEASEEMEGLMKLLQEHESQRVKAAFERGRQSAFEEVYRVIRAMGDAT